MLRKRVPEIMDDPSLDRDQHLKALEGLARINAVTGSSKILWNSLRSLALEQPGQSLRVLDVATGSGDLPLRLARQSRREHLSILIDGCDMSDFAVELATKRAAESGTNASFSRLNVLEESLPAKYDVIMTSLFTHHLDPPEVTALIAKMAASAGQMVLVSDLVRSRGSMVLVGVGTRLLTDCKIVHHDGTASVRAAYTISELCAMAKDAGLEDFSVEPKFPCRMLMTWRRPRASLTN